MKMKVFTATVGSDMKLCDSTSETILSGSRMQCLAPRRMGVGVGLLVSMLAACGGSDATDQVSQMASLSADGDDIDDGDDGCRQYTIPVRLASGSSTTYNLVGSLCGGGSKHKTVLLLVHGATYDHNYWDFPLHPGRYSFVRAAREAGYATFNIDRVGDGQSDHPDPSLLTIDASAYTVHQVVQALRSGTIRHHFKKIALVGHSMGSAMALTEAKTYNDTDGVVVTGLLHHLNMDGFDRGVMDLYPAFLDPKFATSGYSSGYFTSVPGKRGELFYYLPTAAADVLAQDEVLKQLTSIGELSTIAAAALSPDTVNIHEPVLNVVGEFDSLMCGGGLTCTDANVAANEGPFYASDACLEVKVFQNTGHDLNLHTSAPSVYSKVLTWLDRRVGRSTSVPPTALCR